MSEYAYSSEDEYDYNSDGDDLAQVPAAPSAEYTVVNTADLQRDQDLLVAEVSELLMVSPAVATVLLRSNQWSKEVVQDRFYERETPKAFLEEVGAQHLDNYKIGAPKGIVCEVCRDDVPGQDVIALGCGAMYCVDCWKGYLMTKLEDGPSCLTATCLAYKCNELVPDALFQKLLDAPKKKEHAKWALRSFVDKSQNIKWCPAPGCPNAISGSGGDLFVDCACGCKFCLRCGEEAHPVVTCDQLRIWKEKCANESETANWMLVNTKKCPNTKCSVRIEKNQGCNHMSCKTCRHEFCWICMESWQSHFSGGTANYNCNRFNATASQDSDLSRAKTELERYLFYSTRYFNHAKAETICIKGRADAEAKVDDLQEMTVVDFQAVLKAMDLLIKCRRILKYTYVYGYYLDGKTTAEKQLFEYLQGEVESNTEVLTGLTEKPLESMVIADIMNYTSVTDKFMTRFVEGVEEGLCG
ncbi:hypothetical protein SDRG_12793 [Saprolegnia diclina VS20]|uniref:RBR-type E3 ubiquitin transferase n=1 Tax=Saprolegnia diclina (strain VS20) TaxID=1156394 RepID=T0PVM4_SAPDV|nr:hypothetical protein SDRG_12793 [Saprolegnia diclina VS20]EQC29544.1 hypothetical protein SDRG_12793 [Saprolegnia diclina VS20]|eukprot:XP_008617096.1 hypothetical protein SDRG_12793 [Saprolegnia diclina VS20]